MADFIKRIDEINARRRMTTDPAELQKLDYEEAQLREDYADAVYTGSLAGIASDFDLLGWE